VSYQQKEKKKKESKTIYNMHSKKKYKNCIFTFLQFTQEEKRYST